MSRLANRFDLSLHFPLFVKQNFAMLQNQFAKNGQYHPCAMTVQQFDAQGCLQPLNAFRQGRLRDFQRLGGKTEMTVFGNAQEMF